jgi:hypothetical protein
LGCASLATLRRLNAVYPIGLCRWWSRIGAPKEITNGDFSGNPSMLDAAIAFCDGMVV